MSGGTLTAIRQTSVVRPETADATLTSTGEEHQSLDDAIQEWLLEFDENQPFFFTPSRFRTRYLQQRPGTLSVDLQEADIESAKPKSTVWDTPKLRKLMSEPVGSPVDLTIEEADEIVRLARGRRPDLPSGEQFVEDIRELLGHSIIERLKDVE